MSNERKLKKHGILSADESGRAALLSICMEANDGLVLPYRTEGHGFAAVEAILKAKGREIAETGDFAPGYPALYIAQAMKAARDEYEKREVSLFLIHPDAPPGMMTYSMTGEVVMTTQGLGTMAGTRAIELSDGTEGSALAKLTELSGNLTNKERDLETYMSAGRLEIARHFLATGQEGGDA